MVVRRRPSRLVLLLVVVAATLVAASGTALAVTRVGGDGDNDFVGTDEADSLDGQGGNDTIQGLAGNDEIYGGKDNDHLWGSSEATDTTVPSAVSGDDFIQGQAGNDLVVGSVNADDLRGGDGDDTVVEGPDGDQTADTLSGGTGDDLLSAASLPDSRDNIYCGDGTDEVQADSLDVVASDCEKVEIFDPNALPPDTDPVPEGDYRFNCVLPVFGVKICDPFFRQYHQDLFIKATSAGGGKAVDFYAYRDLNGADDFVGGVRFFKYPNRAFIWRNKTGSSQRMLVKAGSPANVRVQVQGYYQTRTY